MIKGYKYEKHTGIADMLGKTITNIVVHDDYEIIFECADGTAYQMYHAQNCCEDVYIEDICGDLTALIGKPLTMAEESTNNDGEPKNKYDESFTWTYYKLATINGYVTIRWYGTSNGYYCEEAQVDRWRKQ